MEKNTNKNMGLIIAVGVAIFSGAIMLFYLVRSDLSNNRQAEEVSAQKDQSNVQEEVFVEKKREVSVEDGMEFEDEPGSVDGEARMDLGVFGMEGVAIPESDISFLARNEAVISVARVEFLINENIQYVDLYLDAKTHSGGFCWQSLQGSLRMMDENDDYISPETIDDECISGISTSKDQKVRFMISLVQDPVEIYAGMRDADGEIELVSMFTVYNEDGVLYMESSLGTSQRKLYGH